MTRWQLEEQRWRARKPAVLAALSVRLLLDFDIRRAEARELETEMIAGHMRVAYVVRHKAGDFSRSGTPSEPLLAEAAARFMNAYSNNGDTADTVARAVRDGLVHPGRHHALAARILLTFARDAAIIKQLGGADLQDAVFSTAVPVIDFLEMLFAERWHQPILSASSDARDSEGSIPLQQAFAGAFVRFTHFVKCGGGDAPDVFMALAAVARGMAFQLTSAGEAYDIAIPVVMKDEKLTEELMTYILIRLTDGRHTISTTLEPTAVDDIFSQSRNKHPYIYIVMQLGENEGDDLSDLDADAVSEEARDHVPHPDHPSYRLTVAGCSSDIFAALRDDSVAREFSGLMKVTSLDPEPNDDDPLQSHHLIQRLVWERGPGSYDWTTDLILKKRVGRTRRPPGVVVH